MVMVEVLSKYIFEQNVVCLKMFNAGIETPYHTSFKNSAVF